MLTTKEKKQIFFTDFHPLFYDFVFILYNFTFYSSFSFLLFLFIFFLQGVSDPLVILMNASLCFSNAKKFLMETRRIEQVEENEQKNKNSLKNESIKSVESGIHDSGRQLANKQACAATVALLKVWNPRSRIFFKFPILPFS